MEEARKRYLMTLTEEEIMNTISIRISAIEFFDSCVFEGGNIDTKLVQ